MRGKTVRILVLALGLAGMPMGTPAAAQTHESPWLDPTFGEGGVANVSSGERLTHRQAVGASFSAGIRLADGRTLQVGGTGTPGSSASTCQPIVARFLEDGSLDPAFNGTGFRLLGTAGPCNVLTAPAHLTAIAVQLTGKILIGGRVLSGSSSNPIGVVRLNADGSDDPTFSRVTLPSVLTSPSSCSKAATVNDLVVDASDNVVIAGRSVAQVVPTQMCSSSAAATRYVPFVKRVGPDGQTAPALPSLTLPSSPTSAGPAAVLGDGTPVIAIGTQLIWYATTPVVKAQSAAELVVDPTGGLLVLERGPEEATRLLRYTPAAEFDLSFGDSAGAATLPLVRSIAVGSTGRIVAFTDTDLLALDAAGLPDPTFGSGGRAVHGLTFKSNVVTMSVGAGGQVELAGASMPSDAAVFARFDSDGSRDTSYDNDGVQAIAMRPNVVTASSSAIVTAAAGDGSLLVVEGGDAAQAIYRTLPDGRTDAGFGLVVAPATRTVDSPTVDPSGRALVPSRNGAGTELLRYLPGGGLDPTFGLAGVADLDEARLVAPPTVDQAGRIYLALERVGSPAAAIRLTVNGTPDVSFGGDGVVDIDLVPTSLAAFAGDGIVVGGAEGGFDEGRPAIIRLDDSGTPLAYPRYDLERFPSSLHVDPDGRAVIIGIADPNQVVVQRKLADGSPDPSFDTDGIALVPTGLSSGATLFGDLDSSGRVLVGVVSNQGLPSVLRLDESGIPDASYGNEGSVSRVDSDPYTRFLAVLDDGRVTVKGQSRTLARFVAAPSPDAVPPTISVTAPQEGGRYGTNSGPEGERVDYTCQDGGSGLATCSGTLASGASLPVATGPASLTVTATDVGGATSTQTVNFRMVLGFTDIPTEAGTSLDAGTASATSPLSFRLSEIPASASMSALVDDLPSTPPDRVLLGQHVEIEGVASTQTAPMRLEMRAYSPALPDGLTGLTADVFRDGVVVPDCTVPSDAVAAPDPCIYDRSESGDQATISVRTSAPGTWTMGALTVPADSTRPTAAITSPVDSASYDLGSHVLAAFTCSDDVGLADTNGCVGPVMSGTPVDTSSPGTHPFTVTATDAAANSASTTNTYTVTNTLGAALGLTGSIVSNPGSLAVSVVDEPAPLGVTVITGPGTGIVSMSVCGGFTVNIAPNSTVTLTCASVKASVLAGSVQVVTPDGSTSMALGLGGEGELDADGTVTNLGGPPIVTARGFYAPVDMGGVMNTVKGGSTVPIKFEVYSGITELTDPTKVAPSAATVTCDALTEDAIEQLDTSGTTGLSYVNDSGNFQLNWKTPKKPGRCYRVTVASGGASLSALFKLR